MNFNLPTAAAWYLTAAVVSAGVGYWSGWQRGQTWEEAVCNQAAAELLADQEQKLRTEYELQLAEAHDAVRSLRAEKASITQRASELEQEIDRVTSHYREQPQAPTQPLPDCRFTHGFVGLYNAAITPTVQVPRSDPATGADGKTGTAATADPLGLSPVRQPDILHHITGYGARCQAIEAQLSSLIDYLQATQGTRHD